MPLTRRAREPFATTNNFPLFEQMDGRGKRRPHLKAGERRGSFPRECPCQQPPQVPRGYREGGDGASRSPRRSLQTLADTQPRRVPCASPAARHLAGELRRSSPAESDSKVPHTAVRVQERPRVMPCRALVARLMNRTPYIQGRRSPPKLAGAISVIAQGCVTSSPRPRGHEAPESRSARQRRAQAATCGSKARRTSSR